MSLEKVYDPSIIKVVENSPNKDGEMDRKKVLF